ncbi:MAG: hypothetical protein RR088_02325, partial [Clostridia bacterium]
MKKIISATIVIAMVITLFTGFNFNNSVTVAAAPTESQLLEKQRALQKNQEDIQKRLSKLEGEQADVRATKEVLDEQMQNTQEQIAILEKVSTDLDKTL